MNGVRKVVFKNDSGGVIPAYALIQLTGAATVNNQVVWNADQWDGGDTADIFYFNGPMDVADGAYGSAFQPNTAQWVKYDDADTPGYQEEWGPVADSFEIGSEGTGFVIMGGATDGRVLAVAKGNSSGVELSHGIIIAACNATCNTYRVMRVRRVLTDDCDY